ncbi:GLPGLI family protein [Riemerella anatipestifer]|uniref:GLPGLI family protein n=1 Tax=Riemerella anatipestifer TaxID=34085 RepID=UPI0030BE3843
MVRVYILFSLFCFQVLISQLRVDYCVFHRIDSLTTQEAVVPYDVRLFIDGNETLYVSEARIQSDSLRLKLRANMDFGVLSVPRKKGFQSEYITGDLKNNIITQHTRINDEGFKFEWKVDTKWTLDTQTKKIGEYTAKKAMGKLSGRNYTVWYTTEIPIPAGPFKFFGLPGLVLEAEDDTGDVRFELISIKKSDRMNVKECIIENANEKTVKTYSEYLKVFKNAMHARPAQVLYDFADQESKKRLEENYQAKVRIYNNFIER